MKGHFLTSLLACIAIGLEAQNIPASPRLVVGIVIDQLSGNLLEDYKPYYGEKGFRRLLREGRVWREAEYDFVSPDRASAAASVYTGAVPFSNGIPAGSWMDRGLLQNVDCVDDSDYIGIYTSQHSSATRLKVSTLVDELMASSMGRSLSYSVAPHRDLAIMGAGHAASGAYWINKSSGMWCGSTYYGSFPSWMSRYNDENGPQKRTSSKKSTAYSGFVSGTGVNYEVNRLISLLLSRTQLGRDNEPDMLAIGYNAGSTRESYVDLDRALASLLEILERHVGMRNTLVFITSTGTSAAGESQMPTSCRVPGGDFYINRCAALLNMYLGAVYGEGRYVETYSDQEIYLNHRLLEQRQLDRTEVLAKSADFLIQFSGVSDVYTSRRVMLGGWTPRLEKIRNKYNRQCSGDIYIDVLPGWTVHNDHSKSKRVVRHACVTVPVIFYGWAVRPDVCDAPVSMGFVAPTVARAMRIRAPNAASGRSKRLK